MKRMPNLGRGILYFGIAFLSPFTEAIIEALKKDVWPTPQRLVLGLLVGLGVGLLALRAFFDGSVQRNKDKSAQETQV